MRLRGLFGGGMGTAPGGDRLRRVRLASTRVALISTAIVAVLYVAIAVSVVLIVTGRDTAQVDRDITSTLSTLTNSSSPVPAQPVRPGSPQYIWVILPDGSQRVYVEGQRLTDLTGLALPAEDQVVSGSPATVPFRGASFRIVGTTLTVGPEAVRVVVGQSMAPVNSAQSNIIIAESVVGPILLIVVFLGAMTIGRRVAAPIELARVRQLEFTADASHELRTPLSVIEAQTSLALSEPRDAAWYRAAFQRVQGESGRIRRLVEDLLWLARFDSTRHGVRAEHVDLGILARQAADRFTAVADAKRLHLALHVAPEALIVHAPPEWLDRLLGVLVDNACKYAPEAGSVDVSVWSEGGRVRLTVDDSGPGIPPEERPRIFDRFHRATEREGGAGLGLAIADSVVRATGGRWSVGESPSGGASMGVVWPRSLAGVPEPDGASEAPSPAR